MKFRNYFKSHWVFQLYIGLAILLLSSFSVLLYDRINYYPQVQSINEKIDKPIINKDTKITREVTFLCKDKLIGTISSGELLGLGYNGLLKRFPKDDGWRIDDSVENNVKISKDEKQICPLHRNYRHLGVKDGFVVVFEGPLGFNDLMLYQEKIKLKDLPEEAQKKISQSMSFNQLPEEIQAEMKRDLEFINEITLNEALENLSEYKK